MDASRARKGEQEDASSRRRLVGTGDPCPAPDPAAQPPFEEVELAPVLPIPSLDPTRAAGHGRAPEALDPVPPSPMRALAHRHSRIALPSGEHSRWVGRKDEGRARA